MSVEEQVNELKMHMGGIVKMVKDLKTHVEKLEKKLEIKETKEIKEIIDMQKVVDEVLVANSDAIKRIDKEIEELCRKSYITEDHTEDGNSDAKEINVTKETIVETSVMEKRRKCRYFDRGYCKYKNKCRYKHPKEICEEYFKYGKCLNKGCERRHPKTCKWLATKAGCRKPECDYHHGTFDKT